MDCVVPTILRSDCIRTSRITRLRDEAVIATLAVRTTYRMNWREVENVKAEVPDVRQSSYDIVKGAMALGIAGLRAGHQLIPGTETGKFTIHPYPYRPRID